MGVMSSTLHFGIGDPFVASFFTPASTSGYVAAMFLLMLLAILQRLLLAFTAKASHKLSAHVQPSYRAEPDTKSGSWVEIEEDVRPAEDLATRLKASVPRAIARSLLQVLNAVMGFLVMLGVMTLNAGYIIALLVGVFVAEFGLSWRKNSHPTTY